MDDFIIIDPYREMSTGIPQLDLYNQSRMSINDNVFERSWQASPLDTIKLIFFFRNRQGGKRDRYLFRQGVHWLAANHPDDLLANFRLIIQYGYYKDLLLIWDLGNELLRAYIVYAFTHQLERDLMILSKSNTSTISNAAKWAPTEGTCYDKRWGLVNVFCEQLGWSPREYRQRISKLREHLRVPERLMSMQRWGELDFDDFAPKAARKLSSVLTKKCGQRYQRWRSSTLASKGCVWEAEEIMEQLIGALNRPSRVDTLTQRWNEYPKKIARFNDVMCVCDVSPSMSGRARAVAYAMTLLIGRDRVISFAKNPKLYNLQGTISEKISQLSNIEWDYNLNFKALLELLQDYRPKTVYIFTDMTLERADSKNAQIFLTNNEVLAPNLAMPERWVFWNLNGNSNMEFPTNGLENGVVILNGYSPSIMNQILDSGDIYPWALLRSILDSSAYNNVRLSQ